MPNLKIVDASDIVSGIAADTAKATLNILIESFSKKPIISLNLSDNALGPEGIQALEIFLTV